MLDVLQPLSTESGGPLRVQHVAFVEGRGNIIIEYPGQENGETVSFAGCHLDVVSANPEAWTPGINPFELKRDGDKLYVSGVKEGFDSGVSASGMQGFGA